MGKTRDLFKKVRDTRGTFHAKMGTIKDRNGTDLTEARTYCKELSKREKDKYFILIHVYGIQKDDTDEPISRVAMEMQT